MKDGSKLHMVMNTLLKGIFIMAIIVASILLFFRRDILAYDDRYGYLGTFVLCFICNATVFAPAPSLIVAVTAAQTLRPVPVILMSAAGTALGEMVGYASGRAGRTILKKDGRVTAWIVQHGALAVFLFALAPLPLFDFAGIASGYSKMRWQTFLLSCFMGKLIKVSIYVFGSLHISNSIAFS